MANLSALAYAVLVLISTLVSASALPQTPGDALPEVIPGPGLPSLESLGLTIEKLFEMGPVNISATDMAANPLEARGSIPSTCTGAPLISTRNFQACINYLSQLTINECVVGQTVKTFVTIGDVTINGYDALQGGSTVARCKDVAGSAQWILDHCYWNDDYGFGGTTVALGNEDFVVHVQKV